MKSSINKISRQGKSPCKFNDIQLVDWDIYSLTSHLNFFSDINSSPLPIFWSLFCSIEILYKLQSFLCNTCTGLCFPGSSENPLKFSYRLWKHGVPKAYTNLNTTETTHYNKIFDVLNAKNTSYEF